MKGNVSVGPGAALTVDFFGEDAENSIVFESRRHPCRLKGYSSVGATFFLKSESDRACIGV